MPRDEPFRRSVGNLREELRRGICMRMSIERDVQEDISIEEYHVRYLRAR